MRPPPNGTPPRPPRRRTAVRHRDPIKRLNIGLLLIAFILSLFAGRLVQLQGIESKGYAERAIRQRLLTLDLPAVRGAITDAGGRPLAMTVEARVIYADPAMVDPAQRPLIAATLAGMLGQDRQRLVRLLKTPNTRYVNLAHGVAPDRARMIAAMEFEGIGALPEYRRVYPNGSLGANILGFVNRDGVGAGGIEHSMNKTLAGRSGWQRVEISAKGQHIPMGQDQTKRPVPGRGVRLTITQEIQWKAQQAIARQVKKTKAQSGSVVVMDPQSGQILALATAPTFDPADYAKAPPETLGNRVVQEAFEPGSTNKVITAAAAMEAGGIRPDTAFTVPDRLRRYDTMFHDSHSHRTERLTLAGVLATSSNIGTMLLSERVSAQQLYAFMRDFGFGEQTGVRLPGETAGLLPRPEKWSGTQRYTIPYGQGMSVNALQTASVYATIANDGVRVTPTLIAGEIDDRGDLIAAPAPRRQRVISSRAARELSKMLEGVTTKEGTAPAAQIHGYRVAGKTGTAQRIAPECGCYRGYTSTFVGYAPADAPQLVVEVVLQDPKRGHYGGDVAAPVFRDVMSFALQSRKVPPTGSESPKIRIYADR